MKRTVFRLSFLPLLLVFLLLSAAPCSADEKRYDVPIGDSPQLGPHDAPITLIEFIDFR